jgi:flagellar biosynthesis protein FlhF
VKIKSYFAKTITEAMERARAELGVDAMIIASNKTSGEAQRLGMYEVVFGLADGGNGSNPPTPAAAVPVPSAPQNESRPTIPRPTEGLERLRERMEDLRKSVSRKREKASQAKLPFSARVAAVLMQSGFPQQVAEDFAAGMHHRSPDERQDIVAAMRSEMNARLKISARLGMAGNSRSTVAIVGPPGAGKTTMIVKLAIKYGIAAGRPTRLISTDTNRFAGADLLRRYADAMDVRLDTPTTVEALDRALASDGTNQLVLIDTEGFGPTCERRTELASFVASRADIDLHLALPSYASYEDLSSMASRFQPFLPSKVILTGLDVCSNIGPALSYVLATESSVSFLSTGREVPEDIEEASTAALTMRLLPSLLAAAAAAA